jgi:phytoene synthase
LLLPEAIAVHTASLPASHNHQAASPVTERGVQAAGIRPGDVWGADADINTLMRNGSKSFFAASRLLPPRYRNAAVSLYAFCRVADDAVDIGGATSETLASLNERLDLIYAGTPAAISADRAFARVVHRYRLPRSIPQALLEGFEWDAQGRTYRSVDDLLDYCARVAGTVGAMMALIMEVRDQRALARACELGVAMQLTNIARDVGEDARMGRVYLPLDWLQEAGVDVPAWLADPQFNPGIAQVVARLLGIAEALYRRAEEGLWELPRGCRPAILAARYIYADIGREIHRAGLDSVNHRAVVSGRSKLRRLLQCLPTVLAAPRMPRGHKALPAIEFLVQAACGATHRLPPRNAVEKAAWMIDLFIAVAEREREQVGRARR